MDMLKSYAKEFKKTEAFGYVNSLSTKVKQMALNLTDLEVKVEEATNNEPWGPHGSAMAEISEAAYDSEGYRQIMGVIARRLQDTGELWRHVYKSLLLLEYMLKHGPQKVVQELSSNLIVIEKLQNFQYKDKNMRDHGENVRHRAKQLCELVMDPERVREERKKAKELKSKYTGVSSDMMRNRLGGGGGGGGGGSSGGRKYYDDEDDDDVYATRESRNGGGAKGDRGAIGQSSRSDSDPMEATRARIEALKARGAADKEADAEGEAAIKQGRKLSTMRVDPKVSASLGLKAPAPAAAAPKARPAVAGKPAQAQEIDLMGGFDDEPAAADAAARSSTDTWNAFEGADSGAASAAPAAAAHGDSWANFGEADSRQKAAQAAKPADPVADLFALDSAPAPQPAKSEPAAGAGDPFGDFGSAPAATSSPAASSANAAPKPTTMSKPALPEDVFSDLPLPTAARPLHPPAYGSGAQGSPYGAGPQGSPYGAPQVGGGHFPQQQGFAQFAGQQPGAVPYGTQPEAMAYGAQSQQGMPGYGAIPPAAAAAQMGGSGSLPAGFGAPSQAQQQPQAHIGDLVPPGTGSGKQQLPASNGNDPFAGLGF